MRESFIFYRSFYEAAKTLGTRERTKFYDAVLEYALNGEVIELSGPSKGMMELLKPQIDANNRKFENGKKGGRPKETKTKPNDNLNETKQKPNHNQNETKTKPNVNVNVNVNDNDNVSGSEPNSDVFALSSSLISYLNSRGGSNYRATNEITNRIGALLDEGYTEADMRAVIDKKVAEWKDDSKMRAYLRPRTLFGDKFSEYVNAPVPLAVEEKIQQRESLEKLQKQRSDKAESLASIASQIGALKNAPGGAKEHRDELRDLRDQQAIAEDSIAIIDRKLERLGVAT